VNIRQIVLALLLFLGFSTPVCAAEEPLYIHAGYVLEGAKVLPARDLQLGYDFLAKRYNKNYNIIIDVTYYTNQEDAIALFNQGKLGYIGMPMATYASMDTKLKMHMGEVFLSAKTNDILEPYVALVRQTDVSALKSFRGKKAAFEERDVNSIAYIDMLSLQRFNARYFDSFQIQYTPNSQRAILMVFFQKADIAFVPMRSWEMAKLMNPALEKNLKIIDKSPSAFGYGIELYNKDLSPKLHAAIVKMHNDLTNSEDGKQLLSIMKVKKRIQIDPSQIHSYTGYYQQYETLLKQYKGTLK
jgi:hypothetical protein